MAGLARPSSISRILAALALAAVALGTQAPAHDAVAALPRWTGGIDLYRTGVFTTQQTWLWCTAADVQIMRNIVRHERDHSRSSQQRYFDYMRAHDRYAIPVRDGVDPAGWAAGLRRFVDGRYRLVASGSFNAALRSAVRNLRLTNRPVGITVSHGNHAWVLTGFTATADPAQTSRFTVTSVRVVGPLWGLQSRSYGYDMRPDTRLTPKQLRSFFTPWHYAGVRMAWEGRWVSIQPIPATPRQVSRATPAPKAKTTPSPAASPSATPVASPPAADVPPTTQTTVRPEVTPVPSPTPTPELRVAAAAGAGPSAAPGAVGIDAGAPAGADSPLAGGVTGLIALVLAAAGVGALAFMSMRARRGHPG